MTSPIIRLWFLLALVVFACFHAESAHAAYTYVTQDEAYSACTRTATVLSSPSGSTPAAYPGATCVSWSGSYAGYTKGYQISPPGRYVYLYLYTTSSSAECKYGYTVPAGESLSKFSDGTRCYASRELALDLVSGSSTFGQMQETGEVCPVESGTPTDESDSWKPGDTENPDGSMTSCDSNGKCVTHKPGSDSPAPASSASGDHSTSANSDTNTQPSSSGSSAGSGSGSGDDSGSGDGSGSGTGTGSGSSGSGSGNSPASSSSTNTKCTSGVCDVGDADGVVGSLYTPGSDTPSSVFNEFKSEVSSAPITQAVSGFFSLTASSSCPTWSIPGNKYWGEAGFTFDFFCQSAILALLQFAGYIVLAVAAYAAFKIAIY